MPSRKLVRCLGNCLAALLVCGPGVCGSAAADPPATTDTIRVAAASDLQTALPALVARFTSKSRIDVKLTFGASGQLAEQIRNGAPFDVFLSANRKFVEDLARDGSIRPESVRPYARGSLVLAVHRESGGTIRGLADLARPEVKKVALANPAFAPYGAAGRQALERAGLWEAVRPKVVQAETVRQALQFVQSGNAEAGLVGRAVAGVPGVSVVPIDPTLYDPIVQGLGIAARSGQTKAAEAFTGFVLGIEGQDILTRAGFERP